MRTTPSRLNTITLMMVIGVGLTWSGADMLSAPDASWVPILGMALAALGAAISIGLQLRELPRTDS